SPPRGGIIAARGVKSGRRRGEKAGKGAGGGGREGLGSPGWRGEGRRRSSSAACAAPSGSPHGEPPPHTWGGETAPRLTSPSRSDGEGAVRRPQGGGWWRGRRR